MTPLPQAIAPQSAAPVVLTEIQSGDGLALSAAGRLFPAHRGDGTVNPSTVFRWVTKGAKAADGRLVKLEAVRVGGRWLTSRPAVARFVAALSTVADAPTVTTARAVAPARVAHNEAAERAAAELKKRGA